MFSEGGRPFWQGAQSGESPLQPSQLNCKPEREALSGPIRLQAGLSRVLAALG